MGVAVLHAEDERYLIGGSHTAHDHVAIPLRRAGYAGKAPDRQDRAGVPPGCGYSG